MQTKRAKYRRLGLRPLSWRTCAAVFLVVASARDASAYTQSTGHQSDVTGAAGIRVVNGALTIDQCVAIALRESPLVRGAGAEADAAAAKVRAAQAEMRPWLSANLFVSGGSEKNIISTPAGSEPSMLMGLPANGFLDQNLLLMLPLYTGGKLQAMVRAAAAAHAASAQDLAVQRLDVAQTTRDAYREILARRALVLVARSRLDEDVERLRIDELKLRQGSAALVTVRRDEADRAEAEQEVTNVQRDADLALIQLTTVMGVDPASSIGLSEPADVLSDTDPAAALLKQDGSTAAPQAGAGLPPEVAGLLALAERQRPEMLAAAARIASARADTSAARSEFGPQVSLFAMGDIAEQHAVAGFAGATYGVVASLPLYNGGQRRARVEAMQAQQRKQQEYQSQIELQVAQEVQSAVLKLRAAKQDVRTAQAGVLAAQEGYRVALERYSAGRSVLVELLDALATRTRAEAAVVQSRYEYGVALDQLLRAVGAPVSSI